MTRSGRDTKESGRVVVCPCEARAMYLISLAEAAVLNQPQMKCGELVALGKEQNN